MGLIEKEENIEVLRIWAKFLEDEVKRLHRENQKIRAEEAKKSEQIPLELNDRLARLKYLAFKKGREKKSWVQDRPRDKEQEELLVFSHSLVSPVVEEQEVDVHVLESHEYKLEEEELKKASSEYLGGEGLASDWKELKGFEEKSFEVTVIERRYGKIEHKRARYELKTPLKAENGEEKTVIITAPGPEKLLPGCTYSIDFAVSVVCDKYLKHLPLERQRKDMERLGLDVSVKTLYNMCWAVGGHLENVAEKIRQEIFKNGTVHCDETRWEIYGKKDDGGYMWSLSNMAGSYYRFEPSRSGKIIDEMLQDFSGIVMSDGYAGYSRLKKKENLLVAHCWAHVRRKFLELEKNYPEKCHEIIEKLDKLFEIDRKARNFEELKILRQAHALPIAEEILEWMQKQRSQEFGQGELIGAISYMEKLWEGLTLFLKNERVPLTNNDAERTLRHAVLGRKNFNGSKTINGADTAATLYTIIQSCKRVELDPQSYIAMAVRMNACSEAIPTPLEYARQIRAPKSTAA